jgi:hypothetical protein
MTVLIFLLKDIQLVDYLVLYDALSKHDWASMYKETSVDVAVDRLDAAVTEAMNLDVPSGTLRFYIKKKRLNIDVLRSSRLSMFIANILSLRLPFYRKLVKVTVNFNSLNWLKSIDANLKSHPKYFGNTSELRKKDTDLLQVAANGTLKLLRLFLHIPFVYSSFYLGALPPSIVWMYRL